MQLDGFHDANAVLLSRPLIPARRQELAGGKRYHHEISLLTRCRLEVLGDVAECERGQSELICLVEYHLVPKVRVKGEWLSHADRAKPLTPIGDDGARKALDLALLVVLFRILRLGCLGASVVKVCSRVAGPRESGHDLKGEGGEGQTSEARIRRTKYLTHCRVLAQVAQDERSGKAHSINEASAPRVARRQARNWGFGSAASVFGHAQTIKDRSAAVLEKNHASSPEKGWPLKTHRPGCWTARSPNS
eukprot:scaffold3022_cov150-Pinguiococcus_pyrenoidosus.AAC.5